MNSKPAFIDLFCGCGGFTLGMERAGFRCVAALDFNAPAVDTLRRNLSHIKYILERDITQFRPDELAGLIGVDTVDVIVGGPPFCLVPTRCVGMQFRRAAPSIQESRPAIMLMTGLVKGIASKTEVKSEGK